MLPCRINGQESLHSARVDVRQIKHVETCKNSKWALSHLSRFILWFITPVIYQFLLL